MKVEELRIGNHVNRLGRMTKVTALEINSDGFGFLSTPIDGAITINQIEPVELNEGWLLKCGFKKVAFDEMCIDLITHYFSLNLITKYYYPLLTQTPEMSNESNQSVSLNRIKYVHELQNLFFALTGKEL